MSNETGKWLPYNKDGSAHDCRTNGNGNGNGNGQNQKQERFRKEYTLDEVQNKLESIGIIINVERLMKE
jgi:hypothetical protein